MEWTEIPEVNLYSDGGAEPNPGNGGFGVIMSYKGIKREFSQGYELTTNNRMLIVLRFVIQLPPTFKHWRSWWAK